MAAAITPRRPQLNALTSVRFFAALHVVFYHAFRRNIQHWAENAAKPSHHGSVWAVITFGLRCLDTLASNGGASVALFFILSGFILAYSYTNPAGELTTTPGRFWIARFARVYPTYLLGILAIAYFEISENSANWIEIGRLTRSGLLNVLMLQSWFPPDATTWNGPGWSLCVEAFFYLLFPWLATKLFRRMNRGGLQAVLTMSLAATGVIGIVTWLLVQYVFKTSIYSDWTSIISIEMPLFRFPEFIAGIALGRLFMLRCGTGKTPADCRFSNPAEFAFAAVPVLIVVSLCQPNVGLWSGLHRGVEVILFSALLYGLAVMDVSDRPYKRLLNVAPLVFLGEASYALYILHMPVIRWFRLIPARAWESMAAHSRLFDAGVIACIAYLVVAIGLASLTFKFLETPARLGMRKLLDRLFIDRRTAEAETPTTDKLPTASLP